MVVVTNNSDAAIEYRVGAETVMYGAAPVPPISGLVVTNHA